TCYYVSGHREKANPPFIHIHPFFFATEPFSNYLFNYRVEDTIFARLGNTRLDTFDLFHVLTA
ncbi:hypothetical protein, partial [Desulfosarcina sp.]|uniref:hypothetical protein n=1 Tax=Desulfosarcina sp. TaxID=2027861 RepID=UPI003566F770